MAISLEALFQHAAALRPVELVAPRDVIGRSTVESIQSGALYGFAAQVDGICRRFVAELGPSTVVATGGLSEMVAPHCELVEHVRAVAHPARPADRLRAQHPGPALSRQVPYRFERTIGAGEVAVRWEALGPGEESGDEVSVAGRVMLSRPQGRLAFAELRDSTGAVQLFALEKVTADFEGFTRLNLGDWVGARGEVVRTKRGELSVKVADWVLLAEARRNFGDKWRGVSDVETRYRQREVDLWANERSREILLLRSRAGLPPARAPLGAGVRRGRDADPPRRRRRGGRPALRHLPPGARRRPLPAHRPRAVLEAAGGRGVREGDSRSGGSSATRGSRPATTPSSPSSSSTRPTPTTTT